MAIIKAIEVEVGIAPPKSVFIEFKVALLLVYNEIASDPAYKLI